MKTRNLLLAGVSALALVAVAGQANAKSNDVRGAGSVAGAGNTTVIMGAAGAIGSGNATAGVAGNVHANSHGSATVDCYDNTARSTATQSVTAGMRADATGDFTTAGVAGGTLGHTFTGALSVDADRDDKAFAANAGGTLSGAGAFAGSVGVYDDSSASLGLLTSGVSESAAQANKDSDTAVANAAGQSDQISSAAALGDVAGAGTLGASANGSLVYAEAYDHDSTLTWCQYGYGWYPTGYATGEGTAKAGALGVAGAASADGQLRTDGTEARAGSDTLALTSLGAYADIDTDKDRFGSDAGIEVDADAKLRGGFGDENMTAYGAANSLPANANADFGAAGAGVVGGTDTDVNTYGGRL